MDKQVFNVGDTVKHRYERIKGVVIKPHTEFDAYYISWDDADYDDNDDDTGGSLCDTESLMLYSVDNEKAQSKIIQAKIDEATAHLEGVFAALREAHKIETGMESDEGFPGLMQNDLLDMSQFEEVLMANGWSTSSIYC
jgi:hypothetical protein